METKSYPVVNHSRKEDITQRVNTLDIDITSDPNSAWNTSTYVPLSIIKLLISETFGKVKENYISLETLADLQYVLSIPEKDEE